MKTVRGFRLPNGIWLVITLAILALGLATLAWQWQCAHIAAQKAHHHCVRHKAPDAAVAAEPARR